MKACGSSGNAIALSLANYCIKGDSGGSFWEFVAIYGEIIGIYGEWRGIHGDANGIYGDADSIYGDADRSYCGAIGIYRE